jgi:hypothetical protein
MARRALAEGREERASEVEGSTARTIPSSS